MLSKLRKELDKELVQYEAAKLRVRKEKEALVSAQQYLVDTKEAQSIIQHVAKVVQESAHKQIASVVSRCLEAVFDEPYEFRISFEQKRGKTEAKLSFVRDGSEIDPLTASGGGVVDLASFGLRLACLLLSRPQTTKVILLDEPFKFLSEEFRPRLKAVLEMLSHDMGVQIVMVTHLRDLEIGKVIKLPIR